MQVDKGGGQGRMQGKSERWKKKIARAVRTGRDREGKTERERERERERESARW